MQSHVRARENLEPLRSAFVFPTGGPKTAGSTGFHPQYDLNGKNGGSPEKFTAVDFAFHIMVSGRFLNRDADNSLIDNSY